jgi:prevent-host-death family protein
MAEIAAWQLRNETGTVLERVEAGEPITITLNGHPVAELVPVSGAPWIRRDEFVRLLLVAQSDSGLSADLAELAGESPDDFPFR